MEKKNMYGEVFVVVWICFFDVDPIVSRDERASVRALRCVLAIEAAFTSYNTSWRRSPFGLIN